MEKEEIQQLDIQSPKGSTQKQNFNVFCWGKNLYGELGLKGKQSKHTPAGLKFSQTQKIVQISPGMNHTAVILQNGKIWVTGSALHGKLGIDELKYQFNCLQSFKKVESIEQKLNDMKVKAIQVACGDYHTLCLLENGLVYSWGGTLYKKSSFLPAQITSLQQIKQIGCGDYYSAALDFNGQLFTWGGGESNNKGQLGHGNLKDQNSPKQVAFFVDKRIRYISCGGHHIIAQTENDDIYGWGAGSLGECGYGEFIDTSTPKKVDIQFYQSNVLQNEDMMTMIQKPKIIDIKCGGHHSLFLSNKGHVYATGYNSYGQLGLNHRKHQESPRLVYSLTNKMIMQIACGWDHSMILTSRLDVYACGLNSSGQLGLGPQENFKKSRFSTFQHVKALGGKNVQQIIAGGKNSWVILDPVNPYNFSYDLPSPLQQIKENDLSLAPPSEIEPIYEKGLQICFTEVQLCHRFIRVFFKKEFEETFKFEVLQYINEMNTDPGMKFHNIVRDEIVIEEKDGEEVVRDQQYTYQNQISYTIMLICDFPNNVQQSAFQKKLEYEASENAIGSTIFLKESDLQKDDYQKFLASWMFRFNKRFNKSIDNAKFFELRPFQFFSNKQ